MSVISTHSQLQAILGQPTEPAISKSRGSLGEFDRSWLAASPFCVIATSDANGRLDASPKGDPAGFIRVLDDVTVAIPERSGNRRADGFHNILDNPHVGILSLIPGRNDTLRIAGRAEIVDDGPFFDDLVVKGHRPVLALVVTVEQVFFHCAKAFMRSQLWKSGTWTPEATPSPALRSKALERRDWELEEIERYYGPEYETKLYS